MLSSDTGYDSISESFALINIILFFFFLLWIKYILSCIKQYLLNITFSNRLLSMTFGAKVLSDVGGVLILSFGTILRCHELSLSIPLKVSKHYYLIETLMIW